MLALRAESFLLGNEPSGPASVAIREALHALGVPRIIELREYGPEFEQETTTAEFLYTGAPTRSEITDLNTGGRC